MSYAWCMQLTQRQVRQENMGFPLSYPHLVYQHIDLPEAFLADAPLSLSCEQEFLQPFSEAALHQLGLLPASSSPPTQSVADGVLAQVKGQSVHADLNVMSCVCILVIS